jgi:aminopeptidase N
MSSVHDFAWFAWDRFKCSRRSAAAIELEICVPPGHERNAALETAEIVDAMPRFQARFGAYPYRDLVVVHPPDVANPAGGMEYPGLIVTGAPWYTSLTGTRMLSAVTLHELAHQWFYGIVATDEVEYPVLDEGLASWAELTALTDEYGSGSAFSGFGITVSASAVAQWSGTNGYKPGPLAASARTFSSFSQLTSSVYARMTLLLQTLGNVYGQQRLRAALQAYARDNRFEHPGPQALVTAFESEMGAAAAANLERALHADAWVDFEPTHIEATSVDEHQWTYTIHVHRAGTLDVPVDVAVMLNNGQVQVMRCEFRQAECMLQARTASPLSSVTVDPHRSVTIESRCGNNTLWFAQPQRPWRLFERLLYGLQVIAGELIL